MTEEINEVTELISYFEDLAESYPYLMDYDILIIDESTRPIVIMSPEEFNKLKRSIVGEVD